jgi:hypothetical protein
VWRLANAITLDFPANTTIPAHGTLVVVPFNPATDAAALAAFQSRYGTSGTLIGPYSGKLDNAGETVELWRPDPPQKPPQADAGFVPWILVERVAYDEDAPWPMNADGAGASLQRIVSQDYGNDPINWRAALPTAGRPNSVLPTGSATLDGDGTVRLAFTVAGGAIYQLQYKENLDDPEWQPFGDPILAAEDGFLTANVVIGDHPRRFYRLAELD